MHCIYCGEDIHKKGLRKDKSNKVIAQRYKCNSCGRQFSKKVKVRGKDTYFSKGFEEVEEYSENGAKFQRLVNEPCRTVEDVFEKTGMDPEKWEVEKFKCVSNQWEMGWKDDATQETHKQPLNQWKLFVWFKKRGFDSELAVKAAIEEMKKHAPVWPAIKRTRPKKKGKIVEFDVFDLHLGTLCWEDETSQDQNLQTAYALGMNAVEDMLNKCGSPEKILFPIGNDFLHIDTLYNTTARGTRLDVDGRPHKLFAKGHLLLVNMLETMATVAPVEAVVVPGNHDTMSCFHLGLSVEAYFHKNPRITFDNGPGFRKYQKAGNTLIGYSHGSKDDPKPKDLPNLMAQENRENGLWCDTEFAEFHTGHFHKKKKLEYVPCTDKGGVIVYVIPSLCSTDAWHSQKGFVNWNRCAELRVFDKEHGPEDIRNIRPRV